MLPILTRVAFHSSIIHPPPAHLALNSHCLLFSFQNDVKIVHCWQYSKKKRRLRKDSEEFQTWKYFWEMTALRSWPCHEVTNSLQARSRGGFPNTQRGALRGGALLWLNQAQNLAWRRQTPAQGVQGEHWCRDWRQPSITGMSQDVCWQKLWFELLVQPANTT